MEDTLIFKSYLRETLEHQKVLERAIVEKDYEKAKELVKKMIQRTQHNLESN